jgi:hypothetical protein
LSKDDFDDEILGFILKQNLYMGLMKKKMNKKIGG